MPFHKFSIREGFSLIELMVVISLFGIAASLVTASYVTFERSQRLKGAAVNLKNDLRLVQNKAISGDKGPGGVCAASASLGGWNLLVDFNPGANISYKSGMDCLIGPSGSKTDTIFLEKTVNLPSDIKINRLFYCAGNLNQATAIFFRPLKSGVSFHDGRFAPPDFFEPDGVALKNAFPPVELPSNNWVAIELSNTAANKFYWVKIEPSGEINEAKTVPSGC